MLLFLIFRAVLVALIFNAVFVVNDGSLSYAQSSLSTAPENADSSIDEIPSLLVTPDYIIGPEDVLDITVWRNTDLSKSVTVRTTSCTDQYRCQHKFEKSYGYQISDHGTNTIVSEGTTI